VAAQEGEVRTRKRVRPYRCFLVRCRLEGDGQPAWRFTVQQAGAGGARRAFTCFDDVAAHMQAELASCEASVPAETSTSVHSEVEP
jgi:hypothetical protein